MPDAVRARQFKTTQFAVCRELEFAHACQFPAPQALRRIIERHNRHTAPHG